MLKRESNDFKPKVMESLSIARDDSVLHEVDSLLPF